MNAFFSLLSAFFAGIPGKLRPFRFLIAGIALLGTAFMGFGASKFELDTSFDSWLSEADPAVQALDDFRRQFGSDDGLFLVYRTKDGDVFSVESLKAVQSVTSELNEVSNYYS